MLCDEALIFLQCCIETKGEIVTHPSSFIGPLALLAVAVSACGPSELYLDPNAALEDRVNDLASRMTLEEKVSQMLYDASAVERLGVPEYNMAGKTYRYFGGEPLFPFGHGLSYSTFTYSNLELPSQVNDHNGGCHWKI